MSKINFNPTVEKIDGVEYITYKSRIGKIIMDYDNKLSIKDNFIKKYKSTEGYDKLKLLLDNI